MRRPLVARSCPGERVCDARALPGPWPAVGAESDPLRRARQLQRSWERLLADGALGLELPPGATAGLRPTIVESWRRRVGGARALVRASARVAQRGPQGAAPQGRRRVGSAVRALCSLAT